VPHTSFVTPSTPALDGKSREPSLLRQPRLAPKKFNTSDSMQSKRYTPSCVQVNATPSQIHHSNDTGHITQSSSRSSAPSPAPIRTSISADPILRRSPTTRQQASKKEQKESPSLLAVLKSETGFASFRAFVERERSVENLLFWADCEKFRQWALAVAAMSGKENIYTKARQIWRQYISPRSSTPVTLSGSVLRPLGRLFARQRQTQAYDNVDDNVETPTKTVRHQHHQTISYDIFAMAQREIFASMDKDSYCRFLASTNYRELLTTGWKPAWVPPSPPHSIPPVLHSQRASASAGATATTTTTTRFSELTLNATQSL
jgi:hypothetical protein